MVDAFQLSNEQRAAKDWLARTYMPYVMVLSSPNAMKKMALNNLKPAEFLRPYGIVGNLGGYQLKTNVKNEQGCVKLNNFRVNFVDQQTMCVDQNAAKRLADTVFKETKPTLDHNVSSMGRSQAKEELLNRIGKNRKTTETSETPWYSKWKQSYLDSNRFQVHELTQQPVGIAIMISVDDEDPIGTIQALRNQKDLPIQYQQGIYDNATTNIRTFVLIINDKADTRQLEKSCGQLRSLFPTNIINEIRMSGQVRPDEKPPMIDSWKQYVDLSGHNLNQRNVKYGQLFLKEDREICQDKIYKMIGMHLMPHIQSRLQTVEQSVSGKRKGVVKSISRFFGQGKERGDNDGERPDFKMNKTELELRTLTDLAFIVQDYETVVNNISWPLEDFKKCKAFKFSAHCMELELYSRMAHDRDFLQRNYKDFVKLADDIFYTYHKKATKANIDLVKFCLFLTEIFQELGKHKDASDVFIKLASIYQTHPHKALLFEQAAYEFLMMQQYRKFSFYMQQAANVYGACNMKEYQINCLMILHPFYESHTGWNNIQYQLFTVLSQGYPQNNTEHAVQYFKDLLSLATQFTDARRQRECLDVCLNTFKYLKTSHCELGQFQTPKIQAHTVRVFTDSELIASSDGVGTFQQNVFRSMHTGGQELSLIDRKPEMNSNQATWSIMQKAVTGYIKKEHEIKMEISVDEIVECEIYDSYTDQLRQNLAKKKIRKVFVGQPITVEFRMKNYLQIDVDITNLRLEGEGAEFTCKEQHVRFGGNQYLTIKLAIIPLKPGNIKITRIKWDLFEKFKCNFDFAEQTGLMDCSKIFQYSVNEKSSEINADVKLARDMQRPLIYNETTTGTLVMKPTSPIKNVFLICSHSQIFGFQNKMIAVGDEQIQEGEIKVDLKLRATKTGNLNIKFLLRYEVVGCETNVSKYRWKRIELNFDVIEVFQLIPSFHLSKKVSDLYNTQIETRNIYQNNKALQNMKPKITQIRIVQPEDGPWYLQKKESQIQFFELYKGTPKPEAQILNFIPDDITPIPSQLATVINNQIIEEKESLTSPLNLIILWQIDQIRGFTVLSDLRPSAEQKQKIVKQRRTAASLDVLPPIVTFDFPKFSQTSKSIILFLDMKNQGSKSIEVDLTIQRHQDFMWIGKTKHICTIQPQTVERIKLKALAHNKGYIDLNCFALQWRSNEQTSLENQQWHPIRCQDSMIVEVSES